MSDTLQDKPDRAAWIKGAAGCNIEPAIPVRVWRLVLLGAPGVGKGTQAQLLTQALGACHLSTGDVFRNAKTCGPREQSPPMRAAMESMSKGQLVSDDTVLGIVRERVKCLACGCGFLLDGFPRTVAQAEALAKVLDEKSIALDAVLDYQLPIDEIVSRLGGRRTCAGCKAVYHIISRPPALSGVCDVCGHELVQREDDRPQSIRVRMEAYHRSTLPLTEFYRARGLLLTIDAHGSAEQVLVRALKQLPAVATA